MRNKLAKKNIESFISVFLSLVFVFTLSACDSKKAPKKKKIIKKIIVVEEDLNDKIKNNADKFDYPDDFVDDELDDDEIEEEYDDDTVTKLKNQVKKYKVYGSGNEAFAVFGDNVKFNHIIAVSNSGDEPSTSNRLGKSGWQIFGNGKPSLWFKLSNQFIAKAKGKDLIVTVEFFADQEKDFSVKYANNIPATVSENIKSSIKNTWDKKIVRITDIKYGGASSKDFTINIDGNMRIASVRVKFTDKASYTKEGVNSAVSASKAFIGAHAVKTVFPTDEMVVADVNVKYFGAVGDGVTDDTAAFKSAIDYISGSRGGTIFVPSGKYLIKDSLDLPSGICLRGDAPEFNSKSKAKGTILYCMYGKGETEFYTSKAFISAGTDACIKNISVYYPEQTLKSGKATPYAFTISLGLGATIDNINLINSYRGIRIGPEATRCQTVRNVYGTPLETGLYIDHVVDITKTESINFTPNCWLNSGLKAPEKAKLTSWLINNATGILYERVDWTYFWDFTVEGYKIGMHSRMSSGPSDEPGCSGGQAYNMNIINCNICMYIDAVTGMGGHLTDSVLKASGGTNPTAIKFTGNYSSMYSLNNCNISSTGKNAVVNNGTGSLTVVNCNISSKSGAVVDLAGSGECTITNSTFSGGSPFVNIGSKVKYTSFVNNMTKNTFKVKDNRLFSKTHIVYDSTTKPAANKTDVDYEVLYKRTANKYQITDVSKSPYNVVSRENGTGRDVAVLLQNALNEMSSKGGGIVYIPAGDYRLDSPITIPSGVELKGPSECAMHSTRATATFYTNYGQGKENATPLITLSKNSGLSGLRVYHDEQRIKNIQKYPYVIRAEGADCYVTNVMLTNAYQGIDFATNRCDRHVIMDVHGIMLKTGIKIGGNSKDGILRGCLFNSNSWSADYNTSEEAAYSYKEKYETLWGKLLKSSDAYVIEKTQNELLFTNFVYGCWHGFIFRNGADVYSMGNAVDGAGVGFQIEDVNTSKPQWFIASQLCVAGGTNNEAYLITTPKFEGIVNMIQTLAFGDSPTAMTLNGTGTVNMIQAGIERIYPNTEVQMTVNVAKSLIVGVTFAQEKPKVDIVINDSISKCQLYGNIFKHDKLHNIINNAGNKVIGADIP